MTNVLLLFFYSFLKHIDYYESDVKFPIFLIPLKSTAL